MRASSSAHQRYYKGNRESGAGFSLDRVEVGRKASMEDKDKGRSEDKSSGTERVALKKEIGLLSACAIIIGECGGGARGGRTGGQL